MATVAAVVGVVAAIVGVVVTVVRVRWDRQERKRRAEDENRPRLQTFTLTQMRDEITGHDLGLGGPPPNRARSRLALVLVVVLVAVALTLVALFVVR